MYTATIGKLYSYRCTYCDAHFDISLTYMSDVLEGIVIQSGGIILDYCPICGSDNLIRDYKTENTQVAFKGKGFYSTDNRKGSKD